MHGGISRNSSSTLAHNLQIAGCDITCASLTAELSEQEILIDLGDLRYTDHGSLGERDYACFGARAAAERFGAAAACQLDLTIDLRTQHNQKENLRMI